jgi:hypothetical protein
MKWLAGRLKPAESHEAAVIRGADAKALLDNPIFRDAFAAAAEYVEAKALDCDADNKEAAQRVIITKQILASVRREIERHVANGQVAQIQIAELEKRNRLKLFRR